MERKIKNGLVREVIKSTGLSFINVKSVTYGECPFCHKENAFLMKNERYFCMECGSYGDLIDFVMRYKDLSEEEAIKMYCESSAEIDNSLIQGIYEINKDIMNQYEENLFARENPGITYLKQRGLTDETIKSFHLGVTFGSTYKKMKAAYSQEVVEASNLYVENTSGEERFMGDFFYKRVMFPIFDEQDHVIGFGGRVMDDRTPKYLNTGETVVFSKGKHLYALDKAMHTDKDYLILCEGYMDVIAMHQAGFTNAVAGLGTALTRQQAQLLHRHTKTVLLAQDADEAGMAAAEKAAQILIREGLTVKRLIITDAKDPDEYIQKYGKEAFEKCIENAVSYEEWKLRSILEKKEVGYLEQAIRFVSGLDESKQKDSLKIIKEILKQNEEN